WYCRSSETPMDPVRLQVETVEPEQLRPKAPEPSPEVRQAPDQPPSPAPQLVPDAGQPTPKTQAQTRPSMKRDAAAKIAVRWFATLLIAAIALVVSLVTWDYYVTAPWTRDGRIRVQVANVAPQVSGQVTELRVADNQYVHKGDVLYVIDPFDFEVTLHENEALVQQRMADL